MVKLFSYKMLKFEELTGSSNYTVWNHNIHNIMADKKDLEYLNKTNNQSINPLGPKIKSQNSKRLLIKNKQLEWNKNNTTITNLLIQAISKNI